MDGFQFKRFNVFFHSLKMPNTKIKKKAPEPPKPEKPVKPVVVAPNKPVDSDDAPDIPDPEEVKARKTKIKASQDVRRPTKGATNNPLENFSREDILRKGIFVLKYIRFVTYFKRESNSRAEFLVKPRMISCSNELIC